jgi:hypothetical protein
VQKFHTPASDAFAVGMSIYSLLTGNRPWVGFPDNDVSAKLLVILVFTSTEFRSVPYAVVCSLLSEVVQSVVSRFPFVLFIPVSRSTLEKPVSGADCLAIKSSTSTRTPGLNRPSPLFILRKLGLSLAPPFRFEFSVPFCAFYSAKTSSGGCFSLCGW